MSPTTWFEDLGLETFRIIEPKYESSTILIIESAAKSLFIHYDG